MRGILILFILVFWGYSTASGQSSTSYDVEFSRICLIDSIAPDTLTQFWRFTQANNPGGIVRDYTYDLSASYTVAGTVRPCCSCLTSASDRAGLEIPGVPGNNWGAVGFLAFMGLIVFVFIFFLYMVETKAARFACTLFFLTLGLVSQGNAQSETSYDVEFTCICLVDSIAADTVNQFWRFTQANNPGGIVRDYTYDLSATYTVAGTVYGCKDYYLGDNPGGSGTAGTLAIWTGTNSLGNSSLTESAEEAAWDLTGALTVPSGTDAQVPVWGAGKLRYNTTAGGFQGGANGYYLPFASSSVFSNTYIPYSDGNRLITSSNFVYSSGELRVNKSDQGDYKLQIGGGIWVESAKGIDFGANTNYLKRVGGSTMTLMEDGGRIALKSGASGGGYTFLETNGLSYGNYILLTSNVTARTNANFTVCGWDGFGGSDGNNIIIRGGNGQGTGSSDGGNVLIRGGKNSASGSADTAGIVIIQVYPEDSNTPLNRVVITEETTTIDSIIIFSKYGAGNITGTPTYSAAYTASGQLIEVPEKWGTISTSTDGSGDITVAHGMGTTPTSVQVTVTGTTPYVVTVHTIDATNFTVRFYDMTGAAVTSTAVTATWHAKT